MEPRELLDVLTVVRRNFSDISTWLPKEYTLNQTYSQDRVGFPAYLTALREDTLKKIEKAKNEG